MLTAPDTYQSAARQLSASGYALIRTRPDDEALMSAARSLGAAIGAHSFGYVHLHAADSPVWLGRHTESLTDSSTPLRYFALGCLTPAAEGGQTLLYDGAQAARLLMQQLPEAALVRIRYRSAHRPQSADHPLITVHGPHGWSLRFRSACENNAIIAKPANISDAELYAAVEGAVSASLAHAHWWRAGDLLIVDNHRMIHSRAPFTGPRHMLRVRYDDPIHQTVTLGE